MKFDTDLWNRPDDRSADFTWNNGTDNESLPLNNDKVESILGKMM